MRFAVCSVRAVLPSGWRGKPIDTKDRWKQMVDKIIQDWTDSEVPLKFGENRHVRYKVYQYGNRLFQEIRDVDDTPIHTLELPQGMVMEQSSYEVVLRYVLMDVVNA
jgi:hypothetical protein